MYASDLNPIAMLLTWSAFKPFKFAQKKKIDELKAFQKRVFELADKQITEWGDRT